MRELACSCTEAKDMELATTQAARDQRENRQTGAGRSGSRLRQGAARTFSAVRRQNSTRSGQARACAV